MNKSDIGVAEGSFRPSAPWSKMASTVARSEHAPNCKDRRRTIWLPFTRSSAVPFAECAAAKDSSDETSREPDLG